MCRGRALCFQRLDGAGRPSKDRCALARAFIAKSVWNLQSTRALIDRLMVDTCLRRLCGWQRRSEIPSESTFSRAFAEFAQSRVAERMHEAVISESLGEQLIGHVSRDSTAIEAREKAKPKKAEAGAKRARKGKERHAGRSLLEQQAHEMGLDEMLDALPKHCDRGTRTNAKGFATTWQGYKLHMDTADCDVPLSAILTSASMHDSQAAIPLAMISAGRVTSCYDLMDAAYDAREIREFSKRLGHVPIIDVNPRRNTVLKADLERERRAAKSIGHDSPERVRFRIRSSAERSNGRLKDEFGGRHVTVRGHAKVACHLMFGVLVLAVDQLMRLASPP